MNLQGWQSPYAIWTADSWCLPPAYPMHLMPILHHCTGSFCLRVWTDTVCLAGTLTLSTMELLKSCHVAMYTTFAPARIDHVP